ncbi:MAG: AbrB/MazE/SpoVT family DNA-binding domain-containing protein [Opitutaceae bacterium]|jgi:bifunctional DNA-binding transcriptional regulator/antitoxin component of YhaV-PrlF toxin-antitoxin module
MDTGILLMLASGNAAMQHCGMATTLPVSKRGALTLPPDMRRRLGLDRFSSPMVIVEEREGGLFLQPAAAVPMRDIPKETIERWIARDEAEMAEFASAGKRKRK